MAGEVAQPAAPKTSNGAPKAAPQSPAPSVPVNAPIEAAPDIAAERAALASERKAQELKMVRAQRKYTDELKTKEKTWGEKLSKLTEYEKREAQAKINKSAYLESLYGKDWYDQIVQEKINGGAPTADVVASEIARLREEFEGKLAAKDAEQAKSAAAARNEAAISARRQVAAEAAGFMKKNAEEFPRVCDEGTPEQVAAELAREVERIFHATTQRDEQGRVLVQGEIIPLHKLAEAWEARLVEKSIKTSEHPKYADRFKPKVVPKDVAQQQRRTLSNDLTGSTTGRPPPVTDAERRERAIAAINAARSKSQP